jgi:GNAT superfamily N-acetyltransferase
MTVPVRIRFAMVEDAERIAHLSGHLGYASTAEETARRLGELGRNSEHAVLVAESGRVLLGWVHVHVSHSLVTDTPTEIAGLVVDEQQRRRGIGQMLMEHAEQWAQDKGCRSVRLRSNVVRNDAHAFYEKLGYQHIKTQKAFRKILVA